MDVGGHGLALGRDASPAGSRAPAVRFPGQPEQLAEGPQQVRDPRWRIAPFREEQVQHADRLVAMIQRHPRQRAPFGSKKGSGIENLAAELWRRLSRQCALQCRPAHAATGWLEGVALAQLARSPTEAISWSFELSRRRTDRAGACAGQPNDQPEEVHEDRLPGHVIFVQGGSVRQIGKGLGQAERVILHGCGPVGLVENPSILFELPVPCVQATAW